MSICHTSPDWRCEHLNGVDMAIWRHQIEFVVLRCVFHSKIKGIFRKMQVIQKPGPRIPGSVLCNTYFVHHSNDFRVEFQHEMDNISHCFAFDKCFQYQGLSCPCRIKSWNREYWRTVKSFREWSELNTEKLEQI